MRNRLFIELLLLLMPKVRFREVDTVLAVFERQTKTFLAGLKRTLKSDPSQPMSKLAQKRSVSRSTISRAVNEDLDMKSYVRRVRNLLTTRSRALRAERCPKLLNHLKHKGGHVRVFVDEKKFVVDEVANKQNTRIIVFDPSEVPPVMQSKNPASVMVKWSGVNPLCCMY